VERHAPDVPVVDPDFAETGLVPAVTTSTKNAAGAKNAAGPPVGSVPARSLPGRLDTPLTSYYLVLGASVALICIGLVMVLSSSSVDSMAGGQSAFTVFWRQAIFAVIGVPLMVLASRISIHTWNVVAWPMLCAALLLELLVFVPGLGKEVNGNRNWIAIAGFTMQPSEAAKLALLVWGATVLTRKHQLLHEPMHALVPVVPGATLLLALVLLGHDMGTALVVMALVATVLFVAGAPLRIFAAALGVAGVVVLVLVQGSSNRMTRISTWTSGCTSNGRGFYDVCWQITHGQWALASGGWLGEGLGASREKWGLLPEAHNDFIFAVIGEELGLVGTLAVLALFVVLGLGLFRIVLRTDDLFIKIATGGVLTWVLGQAVINIGAVLGLLPVVGVPLPLVSSGGSALVMTMMALGMAIGFARQEPGAAQALAARAGLVQRSLAVLPVRRSSGRRDGVRGEAVRHNGSQWDGRWR
jgi:cell division protein FtsW